MRAVVPTIARVRLNQVKDRVSEVDEYGQHYTRERRGFELSFQLSSGVIVPAHAVSEGSILTLALFAFLLSPKQRDLVLIDNLERGLHPKALKELVDQLRAIQEQFPTLQIVATTHSPYLLDLFEPAEIRLMCLNDEGHAVCGSIQEHPDFNRWKDEMMPGEFWSMVGEKWLLEKGAVARSQPA